MSTFPARRDRAALYGNQNGQWKPTRPDHTHADITRLHGVQDSNVVSDLSTLRLNMLRAVDDPLPCLLDLLTGKMPNRR